jgi:hypothetical protein
LLILIDPPPVDAGLNAELDLAMVVDPLDIDCDRHVVGRRSERPFDDARAASRRKREVALREDCERDSRALSQPRQRPAAAVQTEQDAAIPGAQWPETGIAWGP